MSEELCDVANPWVTNLVLADDPVPRASVKNVLRLLHTLSEWNSWEDDAAEDLEAIKARLQNLWAPKMRSTFSVHSNADRNPPQSQLSTLDSFELDVQDNLSIPGSILHLYRDRGLWRACNINRESDTLNALEPTRDMIQDHTIQQHWYCSQLTHQFLK